jgi:serine/threonine protein kinase/Tfp pilus assembly protein PilF
MIQRYQVGDQPKLGFMVKEIIYGGMGIVYILESTLDATFKLALKSCDAERLLAKEGLARIQYESFVWMSLTPHPHVVRALGFEVEARVPNLLLEYADGGNLRTRLAKCSPLLPETLRIASEFCEAMTFLSESHSIVHRDIKPENILFTSKGQLKVTDFGLAAAFEQNVAIESENTPRWFTRNLQSGKTPQIAGTLPYMAPEQFISLDETDTRSDVYSFGVVLYEMLSGHRPFVANTAERLMHEHQRVAPPPLPSSVPHELSAIVLRCLAKKPGSRFQSFRELSREIEKYCGRAGYASAIAPHHSIAELEAALHSTDWNNRGYSFSQLGNDVKAVQCYQKGLEVAERESEDDHYLVTPGVEKRKSARAGMLANLYCNMGAALLRLGRIEDARSAFHDASRADPNDGVAYLRLGQLALNEGKRAEGLQLLKRCTECEPGNFDLLLKYLRACYQLDERAIFEAGFQEFLNAKRTDGPFLVAIGCFLEEELGPEVALRCFDAVLEVDEDNVHAWYNRGVTLHRMRQDTGAINSYRNTLRIDRTHVYARLYLGLILLRNGNEREGFWHINEYLQSESGGVLYDLVVKAFEGAQLGIPLSLLLDPLEAPLAIQHFV